MNGKISFGPERAHGEWVKVRSTAGNFGLNAYTSNAASEKENEHR